MKKLENGYLLIENFVPERIQNEIENLMCSTNFPWYFDDEIWGKEQFESKSALKNKNVTDSSGLHHSFFQDNIKNSEYSDIFIFLLSFVEKKYDFIVDNILRIRGRLTFQYPNHNSEKYCGPHVDFCTNKKYYSMIYYVGDYDGDTFLFDHKRDENNLILSEEKLKNPTIKKRITPKKGNLLLFEGDTYHSGNCPIDSKYRIIVNYDFTIK